MIRFKQLAAGLTAALALAAFSLPANAFRAGMGGMGGMGHMGSMGHMHGGWAQGGHFAHNYGHHFRHGRNFAFFAPGFGYYDDYYDPYYDDAYYDNYCYWRHGRRYCRY